MWDSETPGDTRVDRHTQITAISTSAGLTVSEWIRLIGTIRLHSAIHKLNYTLRLLRLRAEIDRGESWYVCLQFTWYLMLMSSAAGAFMRPYLTSTCRVSSWMNSLTVLQSRAVATSSNYYRLGHWIMFSARFWHILVRKLNFHRTSSEIEYFRSHLEKQLAIDTFLPFLVSIGLRFNSLPSKSSLMQWINSQDLQSFLICLLALKNERINKCHASVQRNDSVHGFSTQGS